MVKAFIYAQKDLIESVRAMGASTDYVLNETDKAASYINRTIGVMTGSAMAAKTLGSVGFYMRNALGNVLTTLVCLNGVYLHLVWVKLS